MSFATPYQKSTGKTVHRSSRKAYPSATTGQMYPKRYLASKANPEAPSVRVTDSKEKQ